MIQYLQNRLALSEEGARNLIKGILWTSLQNIALMLPAVYVYFFLRDYLSVEGDGAYASYGFYILLALGLMLVIYLVSFKQYASVYTDVYQESAKRRITLAEKMRKLPLAYYSEHNLSDLTSTVMEDNNQLEQTFSHSIPQIFASFISVSLILLGLFAFNWQLTLALFWVFPLALAILFFSRQKMKQLHIATYQDKRAVSDYIQEGLEEIQEIKSYNGEEAYRVAFDERLNRYEEGLVKGEMLVGSLLNGSYAVLRLGLPSVLLLGTYMLSEGAISSFTFLIFLMIASSIYMPIIEIFNNIAVLAFLDVRIDRMREIQQLPTQGGEGRLETDCYDIAFEGVSFAYEEGKQVLKDVSFTAKQGEVTALVGASGCGKTTLAKLAVRFWDAQAGRILLGGQDIATIDPEHLLEYYSIVFQDVVLFNASVMDNIRIGRKSASEEEVREVARQAQCLDFIEQLPNGFDTILGENGEKLSGGERQRISIARALLKDAPIVILDEATASIDVSSETKVQQAISELTKEKTVLIIAHRMRTVAQADKIVVLGKGQVLEAGSPKDLLARNGYFAQMNQV